MSNAKIWSMGTILLLFSLDVFACGNAMDVTRTPELILVILAILLFITPTIIPWLMGKKVFYIKKHIPASTERRNLFLLVFTPWFPLLFVSMIIWTVIAEFLVETFWGYQYSTNENLVFIIVAYIFITFGVYKLFNITPFRKK